MIFPQGLGDGFFGEPAVHFTCREGWGFHDYRFFFNYIYFEYTVLFGAGRAIAWFPAVLLRDAVEKGGMLLEGLEGLEGSTWWVKFTFDLRIVLQRSYIFCQVKMKDYIMGL